MAARTRVAAVEGWFTMDEEAPHLVGAKGTESGSYLFPKALAVSAASWAVGAATTALEGRYLLGKTLILPLSFTANYLFMGWLLSSRDTERA